MSRAHRWGRDGRTVDKRTAPDVTARVGRVARRTGLVGAPPPAVSPSAPGARSQRRAGSCASGPRPVPSVVRGHRVRAAECRGRRHRLAPGHCRPVHRSGPGRQQLLGRAHAVRSNSSRTHERPGSAPRDAQALAAHAVGPQGPWCDRCIRVVHAGAADAARYLTPLATQRPAASCAAIPEFCMPVPTHRWALVGAVATAILLLVPAPTASAHDSLVSSSPAADSTIDTAPTEIRLRFSEEVVPTAPTVAVSTAGVDLPAAQASTEGTLVTRPLPATLEPGRYDVTWRVVSSDGHAISGTFTFSSTDPVAQAPAPAPAPRSPTIAPTATPPSPTVASSASGDSATASPAPDNSAYTTGIWVGSGLLFVAAAALTAPVALRRYRRRGTTTGGEGT
ncbi:copper resistance protein CopC [Solicola sp. PLA-1-18]|uniref:copper resistance protein CopC n=1 Tax=Solicola sp. PLA-1-18 TaxID=3380532 RepID=UPI003B7733BA